MSAKIDQINAAIKAKGAKWIAGETSVMSRPVSELCGYTELDKSKKQASQMQPALLNADGEVTSSLPTSWDWRNKDGHDWTTRVQDQMGCGSCFVFAACATAEHCMKVQSGSNGWQGDHDFSEQYLLSCADFSCDGGAPRWVLDYLKRDGAPDEVCFPYTSNDTTPCSNACPTWESRITKIHNWIDPEPDGAASIEQIKQAIMDYGSVAAGFAVMTDFTSYTTGVYEYAWGIEKAGHAVTLIGWNDADQCWICKNSWGNEWGENKFFQPHTPGAGDGGYFRIKWGECWIGDGACTAIGTLPTFSLANLTGSQPSGWSNALVARNSTGATSKGCYYTPVLDGDLTNTYINYAGINDGEIRTTLFGCKTYVDGVEIGSASFSYTEPDERFYKNNQGPIAVYGGRHTLNVSVDCYDTVFESDESSADNSVCRQFVWSPIPLGRNTGIPRTAPPIKDTCAGTGYYNCDGFSFAAGNSNGVGYWSAIAALPSASANYGVRLYDRGSYYGVLHGFDQNFIGESIESDQACHYALVNSRMTPAGTYYAGVVNMNGADADYKLEHATSTTIPAGQSAQWNDVYSLSSNSVIDIYEVYITPGSYSFNLNQIDGNAVLGMALYHCNLPDGARQNAMTSSQGTTAGNRSFSSAITIAGNYALAVYKSQSTGIGQTANYKVAVAPRGIYVTAPNGGESFGLGETHKITWKSFGDVGTNVRIEISRNGGCTWGPILSSTPNDGDYDWTVTGALSNYCKIRVVSTTNSAYSDTSDEVFSILSRSIRLIGPTAGETLQLNVPYTIAWSSENVVGNVKVEISRDSGSTWESLSDNWANTWMMFWYVTGPASPNCRMRISSVQAPSCFDQNTGDFAISGPVINVTCPTAESTWAVGEIQTITWNSTLVTGNVKIEISRDGGGAWSTLIADTPNDESQAWTVAGPDSSSCKIRIKSLAAAYVFGTSAGLFDIVTPRITVTSPNPGTGVLLPVGIGIRWDSVPMSGDVKIELSRDNGASWEVLADRTPNDGAYTWSPSTGPNSTVCLVRVSNADNPSISDVIDGTFRISGRTVTVTSPNGGEALYYGEPFNITWASQSVTGNLRADLSRDSGATWTLIKSLIANSGSYSWTPMVPLSNQCRVKISSLEYPEATDTSNADFTLDIREITVIAPNGAEQICPGSTKEIKWTSKNIVGDVNVSVSRDNGQTWTVISTGTANDGSEPWTVAAPLSENCKIKVESLLSPVSDTSNYTFRISDTGMDVAYPNGGESLIAGQATTITWNTCGISVNVNIELSRDGGATWTPIISNTANDGSALWTPAAPDSANCRIRVVPVDNYYPADTSDTDFTIISRTITVSGPNGGERWRVGKPVSISWSSLNASGLAKIELTRDGGTTWTTLQSFWKFGSPYSWTVQSPTGTRCRVRVSSVSYPTVKDTSNADFEIADSFIDVTSPNGGEELTKGETYNITWSVVNVPSGNCKIELSRDGGGVWATLFSSVPNIGSKSWTVTSTASTRCLIRVTSLDNVAITDTSDALFSTIARRITVTSPDGGETLGVGHSKAITWTSNNLETDYKVKIELSRNNGSSYSTLASNVLNSGTFPWTVAAPDSTDCLVRITSEQFSSVTDTSDSTFTIAYALTVPVTVSLEDWTASHAGMEVQVEIRNPGGTTPLETDTIALDQQGSAQFTTTLKGIFDLAFKSSHWLQATVSGVDIGFGMSTVEVRLPNGDCNEDNQVDSLDLDIAVKEWSRRSFATPNADLNGDGRCDAFDLEIIRRNWQAGGTKQASESGGCTIWLGDENGDPLEIIETLAGEPFDIHVWATTSQSTWFIDAAVSFDGANKEGPSAIPLSHQVEVANGDPEADLVWGDALSSYTIPLQKELCGFYKQSGGTRGYGADFACVLMPGSVPATNRIHVARLALRHRMSAGVSTAVSLWNDATNTAGSLNTMLFGTNPIYGLEASVEIRSYVADTIPEAKIAANNDAVQIRGAAVTAAFPDVFYIETDDRSMGIKVVSESHWVAAGNRVDVYGLVSTDDNGERFIQANDIEIDGTSNLDAVSMKNLSLGGSNWNYNEYTGAGQMGVSSGSGLNNIGLLVTTFGKVTPNDATSFYVADGSIVSAKVVVPSGVSLPAENSYVAVTGISSCYKIGEELHRLLRVREESDITTY